MAEPSLSVRAASQSTADAAVSGLYIVKASCGGCTHFVITKDRAGHKMTVGFGQGVVGLPSNPALTASCTAVSVKPKPGLTSELGLGASGGKSTTQPTELESLQGIDVIEQVFPQSAQLTMQRRSRRLFHPLPRETQPRAVQPPPPSGTRRLGLSLRRVPRGSGGSRPADGVRKGM
jgi:hypothetical protein